MPRLQVIFTADGDTVGSSVQWYRNTEKLLGATLADIVTEQYNTSGSFEAEVTLTDVRGRKRRARAAPYIIDPGGPVDPPPDPEPGVGGAVGALPAPFAAYIRNDFTSTFSATEQVGQYVSGRPYVINTDGVQIVAISPDYIEETEPSGVIYKRNGAARNYRTYGGNPKNNPFSTAVGGSAADYKADANVHPTATGEPIVFAPGETGTILMQQNYAYPYPTGNPGTKNRTRAAETMTVVTTQPALDAFAPWTGDEDTTPPAYFSQIDKSKLKNLPVPASWSSNSLLTADKAEQYVKNLHICWQGAVNDDLRRFVPAVSEPNYGVDSQGNSAIAVSYCNMDIDPDQKDRLLAYTVQIGLDYYRWWKTGVLVAGSDGGHARGYGYMMAWAATLLGRTDILADLQANGLSLGDISQMNTVQASDIYGRVGTDNAGGSNDASEGRPRRLTFQPVQLGWPEWMIKGPNNILYKSSFLSDAYREYMNGPFLFITNLELIGAVNADFAPPGASHFEYVDRMMRWVKPYHDFSGANGTFPTMTNIRNVKKWAYDFRSNAEAVITRTRWTGPPEMPLIPVLTALGGGTIRVSPNPNLSGRIFQPGSTGRLMDVRYSTSRATWSNTTSSAVWVDVSWTEVLDQPIGDVDIPGLTPGTTYYVQVRYKDNYGEGPWTFNEPPNRNAGNTTTPQATVVVT